MQSRIGLGGPHRLWVALVTVVALMNMADVRAAEDRGACPVTPQPAGGMLRNSALEVPIMPEGTITFGANRAGFVLPDGSLMIKYGWGRLKPGSFSIRGRRLDAQAPPLRARFSDVAPGEKIQPASLIFPTPGCWEVTGQLDDAKLTFVVRVVALDGIPRGQEPN